VSQGLERARELAKQRKKKRFTDLLHHVTIDLLKDAYSWLKREAAHGVDGRTRQSHKQNLEANLVELHSRIHRGTYRAVPSRRRYIPKPDGRQRPLGIAAVEDKIVQRAVVEGAERNLPRRFLGFSYGFRPGRGQHDALDALAVGVTRASPHSAPALAYSPKPTVVPKTSLGQLFATRCLARKSLPEFCRYRVRRPTRAPRRHSKPASADPG
jgi:hypothetical protein